MGCPERRKKALSDPDSYIGRQYAREQEKRQRQIANRVCSYCKQPGHNRRGCALLKEDIQLVKNRQKEYIDEFTQSLSSKGFGPGTLVKVPQGNPNDPWSRGYLGMIDSIQWENVDFLAQDEDPSRSWQGKERTLARARVVSTFGYENLDDNYWNRPPAFNDKVNISLIQLSDIFRNLFFADADFRDGAHSTLQIVGTTKTQLSVPQKAPEITSYLEDRFRFRPGPRADAYDKERQALWLSCWSKIRQEEYEKHSSERSEKRGW